MAKKPDANDPRRSDEEQPSDPDLIEEVEFEEDDLFADLTDDSKDENMELSEEEALILGDDEITEEPSEVDLGDTAEVDPESAGLSSSTGEDSFAWGDLADAESATEEGEIIELDSSDSGLISEADAAIEDSSKSNQPGDPEELADAAFLEDDVTDDSSDEVPIGNERPSGSSRDLIAEGLESGIDLTGDSSTARKASDSYDELLLGEENSPSTGDSSAINLDFIDDAGSLEEKGAESADSDELASFMDEEDSNPDEIEEEQIGSEDESVDLFSDMTDSSERTFDDEGVEPRVGSTDVDVEAVDLFSNEPMEETLGEEADMVGDADVDFGAGMEETFGDENVAGVDDDIVDVGVTVESEGSSRELVGAGVGDLDNDRRSKTGKKEKAQKGGRGWLGLFVGLIMGGGLTFGAWMFGAFKDEWREVIPENMRLDAGKKSDPSGKNGTNGTNVTQTTKVTVADTLAHLRSGELDQPIPGQQLLDQQNPEHLVANAEWKWMQLLHKNSKTGLNANDPKVQADIQAIRNDLNQASQNGEDKVKADALFWLGHIQEASGKIAEAKKLYSDGQQQFPKDARFEAALYRLDVISASASTPTAKANMKEIHWALILMALQQPGIDPVPPDTTASVPEAGLLFWKANALIRSQKWAEAREALTQAKDAHNSNPRLRQPSNPQSDPNKRIFSVTCDLLTNYMNIQEKLQQKGYLAQGKDPVEATDMVLTTLAEQTMLATTRQTLIVDLEAKQKEAETKIAALDTDLAAKNKALTDAKATIVKRDETITMRDAELKKTEGELASAQALGKKLTEEKTDLQGALASVHQRLEKAEYLEPKADRAKMFQQLDQVIDVAKTKDPKRRIMTSEQEIKNLNGTLSERWKPEEMLGHWLAVLSNREETGLIKSALTDVNRAEKEKTVSSLTRAQALAIKGLSARNQGNYEEARKALGEAITVDAPDADNWKAIADNALNELTKLDAYYLPLARELHADKKATEALAVLDEALKVFTTNNGQLYALRTHVRLDQAKATASGELAPTTAGIAEATQDAAEAIKAGANGAGHYAAGRVAEALGQWQKATQHYQQAVDAHKTDDDERAKYQLALARMLLKPNAAQGAVFNQPKATNLFALMLVALIDVPPLVDPNVEKATELADAILARPDIDKYPELKAKALMIKGLWTKSLKAYVEGLKNDVDQETLEGLREIINKHPRLQRPDTQRVPSPFEAKKFYDAGLRYYHAEKFALAEKEFLKAIESFNQDARYYYFLGFSRLAQGNRQANEDFDQGAELEAKGRPFSEDVNAALERVQGQPRRLLDAIRERVR